ncbi:MAG: M28 family peptidase, partial [Bacilli bacterium]|nr:M28 family peptidase [Bacilli bacterium]
MKETLISNFLRISKIPRESGHEEKIADFFVNVAKENNLYYFKDENNNVLIKKKGNINTKTIALQAHLDMVYVKSKGSNHDFERDGIKVIIDGDKVSAKDTSLGADQGVGLSMMLAIMENNNLKHPDLEFLFTTEEETTFNGAVNFPYSQVESKRLINLDNSNDNCIFIGADGDICNEYVYSGELIENSLPSYRILIDGFPGGNSGEDVNLSETNAITTMANLLIDKDIFIKSIDGGTSENDLATFCEVVINTNINVNDIFKEINAKIDNVDNKISFSKEDTKNILKEILDLKCGYITKNMASANLGLIKT